MRQCLLIDPMHASIFDMLNAIGWHGVDASEKRLEEIIPIIHQYEGIFVRTRTRVDATLLGTSPNLKFVARAGAGLDNIDVPFLDKHNISIVHASEGNRDAVGEYTIGALLALLRNIPRADKEVRDAVWLREENRGMELMGKTVGIIGYGNMGQAFAKRLAGFSCHVLAYDKYKTGFTDAFAAESTLADILENADIISLHVPLTPETREIVNPAFLGKCKKSIVLINTARGEVVTLQTLATALQAGKVKGAVLDVLENEKLTSLSPTQADAFAFLRKQPNVVFTPHIAGWTFESHIKINQILIEKLQRLGF
jgi:D-3-phosphoglycerate dehydrogenase / 2-oxoglutarate reductase